MSRLLICVNFGSITIGCCVNVVVINLTFVRNALKKIKITGCLALVLLAAGSLQLPHSPLSNQDFKI